MRRPLRRGRRAAPPRWRQSNNDEAPGRCGRRRADRLTRHAEAGTTPAGSFLVAIGCPEHLRRRVTSLVAEHMAATTGVPTPRAVRRLALRLAPATVTEWAFVVRADSLGRAAARLPLGPLLFSRQYLCRRAPVPCPIGLSKVTCESRMSRGMSGSRTSTHPDLLFRRANGSNGRTPHHRTNLSEAQSATVDATSTAGTLKAPRRRNSEVSSCSPRSRRVRRQSRVASEPT